MSKNKINFPRIKQLTTNHRKSQSYQNIMYDLVKYTSFSDDYNFFFVIKTVTTIMTVTCFCVN